MNQDKKGIYNIVFGIVGQLIMIVLGMLIPRLVLVSYGSETNGLLNSINQIFMYVSLLEAGVGTASIQALYKPIAKNDGKGINQILSATNHYYKKTGVIYLFLLVIIAIVYPYFVKTDLDKFLIFLVFLFTGAGGAINFLFQGKFRIFLEAEGKNYILSTINTIVYIIQSTLKILLLSNGFSVVIVQFSYFCVNILQMAIMLGYIKIKYSWIDLKVEPDYGAISQKSSALVHQISGMIFNNTDALILSFFSGLKMVSLYSMYNLIITYVMNLVNQVNSGFKYKLGQTYAIDKKKYLKLHNMYEVANMILVFSCFTLVYIFIIPFMKLYTQGATDINYIDEKLPILFVVVQLLSNGRAASNNLIYYAGHFKKTQSRSIIESVINIVVSIVCVWKFGIYGVLFGTIVALMYRTNDIIIYCHKYILKDSPLITYRRWLLSLCAFIISVFIIRKVPVEYDSYVKIILFACLYMFLILGIHIMIQALFERKVFTDYWEYGKKIFNDQKYKKEKEI